MLLHVKRKMDLAAAIALAALIAMSIASPAASAQSSSLYLTQPTAPAREKNMIHNPVFERVSYDAVLPLPPREFNLQDLVTIVIREQSTATLENKLNTEKKYTLNDGVTSFPVLNLGDLLNGQIHNSTSSNLPTANLKADHKFESTGSYDRSDTLTTRLTARIVDIKPNGVLTLEARTFIQNDDEKQTIAVTGFARPEDIAADNSVLSTQMFDLRVKKVHEGELHNITQKGLLTKLLEALFNF